MQKLPTNVHAYKRTPTFTEATVPQGLLNIHQIKAGTWGTIVVLEGTLLYRILEPQMEEHVLSAAFHGVVEPEVPHQVEPVGAVSFYVEFSRL